MYYVYILTNKSDKVMYIGVTNNLQRRLYEHKNELVEGFTKKYHIHLVGERGELYLAGKPVF